MINWWLLAIGAYLSIGVIFSVRMFDYPVGTFWHVIAALFWPVLLFIH